MMYNVGIVLQNCCLIEGLVVMVDENRIEDIAPLNQIKVISFEKRDKKEWILESKYNIGKENYGGILIVRNR